MFTPALLRFTKILVMRLAEALTTTTTSTRELAADVATALAEASQAYEDVDAPGGRLPSDRQLRAHINAQIVQRLDRLYAERLPVEVLHGPWLCRLDREAEIARLRQLRALVPFMSGPALLVCFGSVETSDGRCDYMPRDAQAHASASDPGDEAPEEDEDGPEFGALRVVPDPEEG